MLQNKIKSIEITEWVFFSVSIKITDENDAVDQISVDTLMNSVLVNIEDDNVGSYKLFGKKITNMVEKTTGSLAGGVFVINDSGASFCRGHELEENETDVYFEGSRDSYTIYIGDFQINLKLTDDIDKKPKIDIVPRTNYK